MSMGICDVPKCEQKTYMGWRPLSQSTGFQICRKHFEQHKVSNRQFLYKAFGIEKPPKIKILKIPKRQVEYCDCGKELNPNKPCSCLKDRQNWESEFQPVEDMTLRECPECHKPKLRARQRYCDTCKIKIRRKTKREYQRKFRKRQNVSA